MENHVTGGDYDPAQALSDVATSREAAAARLVTPWWYHPILGANLGALALAVALPISTVAVIAVCLASAIVSVTLAHIYQRLTGVWIGPNECGPRSRSLWLAFAFVIALVLVAAGLVHLLHLSSVWAWAVAAVCVVSTIVIGVRLDATLREEIRAGEVAVPRAR